MAARVRFVIAASIGAAGAVLWAVCLGMLESPSEPARVPGLALAGNNTYWVRDLRWAALFAVTAMVVTVAGGELVRSAATLLGTVGWLAVDILLDRANVHGATTTVLVAVAGVAVSTAACRAVRSGRHRRRDGPVLVVVALAGALATSDALTSSPSDREPALDPISWAVATVLGLAAVMAAASVCTVPARRRRVFVPCLAGAVAVVPAALRAVPVDDELGPAFAWGWALLTVLALLSWGWEWSARPHRPPAPPAKPAVRTAASAGRPAAPDTTSGVSSSRAAPDTVPGAPDPGAASEAPDISVAAGGRAAVVHWQSNARGGRAARIVLLAVLDLVVFAVSSFCCLFGQLAAPFARAVTAWTGNSPVNAADSDILMNGVAVGCGLAVAILWFVLRAVPVAEQVPVTHDGYP